MSYTDETILTKGEYKFHRLREIPAEYFLNIWDNQKGGADKDMKEYIIANLDRLKERAGLIVAAISMVAFICDKRTFATKKMAQDSLKKIRNRGGDHIKPMRSYECPKCSGWHLTSMDIETFKESKP